MASNVSAMRAEDRFNLDPELSYTLPGHYYYDREIFEREKEEIWSKTWQLVGYGADLKEPGDYITNDILDQKVFVTRAKDGRLRAFYNVCMHRGHILLEGKGNVRMITCPFHAWTYDLEGNLKAAGNSENVAGFDAGDFCLPEIQVEELLNMVFVNLDAQAASLASMVPGFAEDVRATVPYFDELVLARHDDYANFKCNWKFIPDQNECYHCPHLHPDVMGSEDSYMEPSWESTEYDYWAKHFILGNRNVKEEHKPYDFRSRRRPPRRQHLVALAQPHLPRPSGAEQLQGHASHAGGAGGDPSDHRQFLPQRDAQRLRRRRDGQLP